MQDSLIQLQEHIQAHIMVPDRIPLAIAAILIVSAVGFLTGPLLNNANSFVYMLFSAVLGSIGDRLDKTSRARGALVFRGFVLTVLTLIFAGFLGKLADIWIGRYTVFSLAEVVFLSLCLTSGSIWALTLHLYKSLKVQGSVKRAYLILSCSTRVDLNSTDNFGITRTGIAFLGTTFDKGLVTPVFWYIFGGLPVLLLYVALSFMAWRFGKCGFSKGFGAVPLALEKLMGYIPSLLSGFLLTAASALTPTANLFKSITAWWAVKGNIPYEEGGICLAAMAWPLNIVIGGPVVDITGSSLQKSWVGPPNATAQVDHNHIRRALYLSMVAHLLYVFVLLCAYIYAVKVF